MYHANVHISLRVKNVTSIKNGIMISVDVSAKIEKNIVRAERLYFESCMQLQNGKYFGSIIDNSVVKCKRTISTKTILTKKLQQKPF